MFCFCLFLLQVESQLVKELQRKLTLKENEVDMASQVCSCSFHDNIFSICDRKNSGKWFEQKESIWQN